MENQPQPQPSAPEPPALSSSATAVPRTDAETLRKNLEKHKVELERNKVELEKLTQKSTASNEYVTRAEKTERDVAKAGEDYKSAFAKLQAAKRDADRANESEGKEATTQIGANQGAVEAAIRAVDQPMSELQKRVADLSQRKATSAAKLDEAQNSLAAAQAALQDSLAYPREITASLKAVADVQSKIQKVKDRTHAAEFYFYVTETRKKLTQVQVKTPDELNAELGVKLTAVGRAISDVARAKADVIDVSVDLDVAQKQLADLEKNREAQILTKIRQYNQPAAKPPEVASPERSKPNAPAK
jgi:DNA repair exonuclease SbcCD ATPase subunit